MLQRSAENDDGFSWKQKRVNWDYRQDHRVSSSFSVVVSRQKSNKDLEYGNSGVPCTYILLKFVYLKKSILDRWDTYAAGTPTTVLLSETIRKKEGGKDEEILKHEFQLSMNVPLENSVPVTADSKGR